MFDLLSGALSKAYRAIDQRVHAALDGLLGNKGPKRKGINPFTGKKIG